MLKQVLQAIETANGPVHVSELSQRLKIERSALEGMILYWIRKGRLVDDEASGAECPPSSGNCGSPRKDASLQDASCGGATGCPFVIKVPKSYSIPHIEIK